MRDVSVFSFCGGVSTVSDVFGGWFKQEIEGLDFCCAGRQAMRTGSGHTERVTNVFSASAFQVSVWMCAQQVAAGGKIFFFYPRNSRLCA